MFTAISTAPLQYVETARLPGGLGQEASIDSKGERVLLGNAADFRSWAEIYRRQASGWVKETTLTPFSRGAGFAAISGDGKIVAIAGSTDTLIGAGPLFPPYQTGHTETGTVAIYDRRPTGWRLRRYVKADPGDAPRGFGWDVRLSYNGHVLAVGTPYDDSRATGIDGDREDASGTDSGAIWLY